MRITRTEEYKLPFGMESFNLTAKGLYGEKCNKQDALSLLNYIAVIAYEAKLSYDNSGQNELAKQASDFGNLIHDTLKSLEYYKA